MHPNLPVYIGDDALTHLIGFCQEQGYTKFLLVADENTYLALGQSVQAASRRSVVMSSSPYYRARMSSPTSAT